MRIVAGLILGLSITGVAFASSAPKKKSPSTVSTPAVPSVQMPMLVAPVIIDGQLAHYANLSVTLILPDDSNKLMLLDKIPYIQDAFLREVHGLPIILGNDPNVLDDEGLGSRLLSLCEGIVGPGIVKKVAFRDSSKDFQ